MTEPEQDAAARASPQDPAESDPGSAVPDVFQYLDYRDYLRHYYENRKAQSRGFSYRAFSRRAQLKSPNYLKLVMDGDRSLSPSMAERFGRACRLQGDALEYFIDLVALNQAKSTTERNAHYARLSRFRQYRSTHRRGLAEAEYHTTWYLPVIHAMAARADFTGDPAWIASQLRPPISKADAQRAVEVLLELRLLERSEEGPIRQAQPRLSATPETFGLHLTNYHQMMMERAQQALDTVPAEDRVITSLTLFISPNTRAELERRTQRFLEEVTRLTDADAEPSQVVQLNLHLFPLSDFQPPE